MRALQSKHPERTIATVDAIPSCEQLPYLEDSEITASHIQFVANHLQGGVGPGGCRSAHWKDALLWYGSSSAHLCEAVAALCQLLCNSIVPLDDIRALLASRVIALDKCPGVYPIGVGETLRHLMGKTICLVTRIDASIICGQHQLCAGLQSGIESAIHAMSNLFFENHTTSSGWGALLIDASNAFNSLNLIAMLLNVRKYWPHCACFVFNTYRGW